MIATVEPTAKRLTMQVAAIAPDTTAVRSQDWDRDRFDIEFGLQNGTTYNSFLIRGDQVALVDTSHEKFRALYFDTLRGLIDPRQIDYLIISHTEPDHSGLVRDFLELVPEVTVVGSKVALQFLDDLVHRPFQRQVVKGGDTLDLGQGHVLEFIIAPNLHWPDTAFTYDRGTGVLYTCDAFGLHYCTEDLLDRDLEALSPDFRFYYECLMAPNARSVLSALKRMDQLDGPIQTIAVGHGPILQHNVAELVERYRTWSQSKAKAETAVAVFYISDYGYSDRLSQAIARGLTKTGVAVEMVDLRVADTQEVQELVSRMAGVVIGMPPATLTEAQTAMKTILAAANSKQFFGLFESYGGNDEPVDPIANQLRDLALTPGFEPIRIKATPDELVYQLCDEAGTDLGQEITRDRKVKTLKAIDAELQKALGRISSGLYIITAQKGAVKGAMVASWVAQASFKPPGFTVSVAKDRAIESLLQVGDTFVLNILEEGSHLTLMKHFLKRFAPGSDRFAGVKTYAATNGSPILADALAYLECQVASRMETTDHWLVYCVVQEGKVSNPDALTAVHHRKLGNYY